MRMIALRKLDTAKKSGWLQRDEVESERFLAVQPDEELHNAVSLEAKFEPPPHIRKVFLIHSLHSGKLLVYNTRKQVPYTPQTHCLGSGQTAQSKKSSKEASKQVGWKKKKKKRKTYVYIP